MADDGPREDEDIEVTPQMIEAGADVLMCRWGDLAEIGDEELYRTVAEELLRAALRRLAPHATSAESENQWGPPERIVFVDEARPEILGEWRIAGPLPAGARLFRRET